jgi:uncharacterized Zn finger protein
MVKCPFCGSEGGFKELKSWKFRFYDVKFLRCLNCGNKFNRYLGLSPKGKRVEFVIRAKQKKRK